MALIKKHIIILLVMCISLISIGQDQLMFEYSEYFTNGASYRNEIHYKFYGSKEKIHCKVDYYFKYRNNRGKYKLKKRKSSYRLKGEDKILGIKALHDSIASFEGGVNESFESFKVETIDFVQGRFDVEIDNEYLDSVYQFNSIQKTGAAQCAELVIYDKNVSWFYKSDNYTKLGLQPWNRNDQDEIYSLDIFLLLAECIHFKKSLYKKMFEMDSLVAP